MIMTLNVRRILWSFVSKVNLEIPFDHRAHSLSFLHTCNIQSRHPSFHARTSKLLQLVPHSFYDINGIHGVLSSPHSETDVPLFQLSDKDDRILSKFCSFFGYSFSRSTVNSFKLIGLPSKATTFPWSVLPHNPLWMLLLYNCVVKRWSSPALFASAGSFQICAAWFCGSRPVVSSSRKRIFGVFRALWRYLYLPASNATGRDFQNDPLPLNRSLISVYSLARAASCFYFCLAVIVKPARKVKFSST